VSHRGLAPLVLVLVVFAAGCGEMPTTPESVLVRVACSTTLAPLAQELAAAFSTQVPGTAFDLATLDSAAGLDALKQGSVDLAMVSWLPSDLACDCVARAVARDGIAIIVHPSNPITTLGLIEVQELFTGSVQEWAGLAPGTLNMGDVQPVVREDGSGTGAAFASLVMEGRRITPRAVVAASGSAVVRFVSKTAGAVGYVSTGEILAGARVVSVEGALPTADALTDGSYPLGRDLWLVVLRPTKPVVEQLVGFAVSQVGQQIAQERYGRMR